MSAVLVKLLLGARAVGAFVLEMLTALIRWMLADWRNGPLLLFALALAAHIFLIEPGLRAERDAAERDLRAERQAHRDTVARYRAAAAYAQRKALANAERVRTEQAATTKEIVDDFNARIARVHARAAELERLREQSNRTPIGPGNADTADLPGTGNAAGGVDQAAGENRLPGTGAPLTPNERLIATEQAVQLDALIDWVIAQSAIPFQSVEASTE